MRNQKELNEALAFRLLEGQKRRIASQDLKNHVLFHNAGHGHLSALKDTLRKGAQPHCRNSNGGTAADIAEKNGFQEIADILRPLQEQQDQIVKKVKKLDYPKLLP